MFKLLKQKTVLPGFRLALGYTVACVSLLLLLPLAVLVLKATELGWAGFMEAGFSARALASYRVSFGCSLAAAILNAFIGLLVAWVLARYEFPGKRLMDAVVDLPFALPTAVAGIALTGLYARNGWIGSWFDAVGIQVAYTPLGITLAMVFIGLPFVVRTVQPVIEELDHEMEEASLLLGASEWTTFRRVLLPALIPAWFTGFALAFARGVGEYGSVVFIAGNMPMKTEIAPLLIIGQLEQHHYAEATAIAVVMLTFSFAMLLVINLVQYYTRRAHGIAS